MGRRLFVSLVIFSAVGCGSTVTTPTDGGSTGDASSTIRCFPGNSNPGYDTACNPATQICVNDYASVSSYPKPNSCQALTADCTANRTCECVLKTFKCGITTNCSVSPDGLVHVTCQPD